MSLVSRLIALVEAVTTASAVGVPRPLWKDSLLNGPLRCRIERAAAVGGGTIYGASFLGRSNPLRNDFRGIAATATYQTNIAYAAFSNYNWLLRASLAGRTGTVTVTVGSRTVTGSGSDFLPEFQVGDVIQVAGQKRRIVSITSDTVLTVDSDFLTAAAAVAVYAVDVILQPTEDFTVSNVGGYCLVTLSAAAVLPAGANLEVHLVTPKVLFTFATATVIFKTLDLPDSANDVAWYAADATATPSSTNVYLEPIAA